MSYNVNHISDIFINDLKKSLDTSLFNKSMRTIIVFPNSEIQNIIDFFLNCKVLVYNFATRELDLEVYDIIPGLNTLLLKTGSDRHYIQQSITEKLKELIMTETLNSSVLLISVTEDDTHSNVIDDFVTVRSLEVFSNFNMKSMIEFLIEHLHVEDTKYITKIDQESRGFFKNLAYVLPDGLIEYNNQVGGHGLIFAEEMKILHFKNVVFKPVQQFPKGRTEILFYEEIFGWNKNDDLKNFQRFLPNYFGLFSNILCDEHDLSIGLEDVLSNFLHPSIADIKLGQVTYEPDAKVGKVAVEKAKYYWREEIGFLFTGIRVFKGKDKDDLFLDRFHGLSLDPDMVYIDGIMSFLSGHFDSQNLAQLFSEKLKSLLRWFESQRYYHFYSSSLLLAYDQMNPTSKNINILVKMIDFTHCRPSTDIDLNSIFGLKSLISYFDRVSSKE